MVNPRSPESAEQHAETRAADSPIEINFDGLRSAITPINLMFDGRLFKDLKGLIAHITHASKKVSAARPDYQGALLEIDQLDATFRAALDQWEKKLTGEIQRLKAAIQAEPEKSLGAAKQINKYQAELNRGRASTRSMPNKTSQVRNQLIAAGGVRPIVQPGSTFRTEKEARFSDRMKSLPGVYRNSVKQILRRAEKLRSDHRFTELALAIFSNVSQPVRELGTRQIARGVLYFLHQTPLDGDVADELTRQKAQFLEVTDLNGTSNAFVTQSVFVEQGQPLEIPVKDFETQSVDVFEPLQDSEIIIKLLKSKFKEDDFKTTFNLYHLLRKKALEHQRDEKFNAKQEAIHRYLTGPVFDFVGIAYEQRADEIRYIGEVNSRLQRTG